MCRELQGLPVGFPGAPWGGGAGPRGGKCGTHRAGQVQVQRRPRSEAEGSGLQNFVEDLPWILLGPRPPDTGRVGVSLRCLG